MIRTQNDGVSYRKPSKKNKSFLIKSEKNSVKTGSNSTKAHSIRQSMVSFEAKNCLNETKVIKSHSKGRKEVKILKIASACKSKLKTDKSLAEMEKIVLDKNSQIEKLQIMVKYFKSLISEKPETLKLMDIIDQQNEKISELQRFVDVLQSDRCDKHELIIHQLKTENSQLVNDLKRFQKLPCGDDWEFLLQKIKNLEKNCRDLAENYAKIKEELEKYEEIGSLECLALSKQETFHISALVRKLAVTLDEVIEKQSFELTPQFFKIDLQDERGKNEKLSDLLIRVRKELKTIFEKIFEIHANVFVKENCDLQ